MESWPEKRRIRFAPVERTHERRTLLLRDLRPVSTLHVPARGMDRARFVVTESRTHFNEAEYGLPDEVLEKVYRPNAERVLAQFRG
jgi:hypothetical protein